MPNPKHRHSKTRRDMRRAQWMKMDAPATNKCPSCGEPRLSHHACPSCGKYGSAGPTGAGAKMTRSWDWKPISSTSIREPSFRTGK